MLAEISLPHEDLGYSMRRFYVDRFLFKAVSQHPNSKLLLDLGGNKIMKRGQFDYSCDMKVIYANIKADKKPDVLADAAALPFIDNCFDIVICSELLEHVYKIESVLTEVHRVLKNGGQLLITVPFLVQMHADPYDYGRYTDVYWGKILTETGFSRIEIERHGCFWSVIVDMITCYVKQRSNEGSLNRILHYFFCRCLALGRKKVLQKEAHLDCRQSPFYGSFTTGFGISCCK